MEWMSFHIYRVNLMQKRKYAINIFTGSIYKSTIQTFLVIFVSFWLIDRRCYALRVLKVWQINRMPLYSGCKVFKTLRMDFVFFNYRNKKADCPFAMNTFGYRFWCWQVCWFGLLIFQNCLLVIMLNSYLLC